MRAYALGLDDDERDPDRAELEAFVEQALDPATLVGDDTLGDEEPFESDSFLVMAFESEPIEGDEQPAPKVVDRPAGTDIHLADATVCAEVPSTRWPTCSPTRRS